MKNPFVQACLVALCASAVPAATGAESRGKANQSLVPASWMQVTDSKGFTWDLNQGGYVNHGTNYCFSNCMVLRVNGSGFSGQSNMMTPDGKEYVLEQNLNGIQVTRRITIDTQLSVCRWVDSFTSTGGGAMGNVAVNYHFGFNNQAQSVVTNTGRAQPTAFEKKEGGLIFVAQPNQSRPSAVIAFASPQSKLKPALQIQHSTQLVANYNIPLAPGSTVSICTIVGQRSISVPPVQQKEAAGYFAEFFGAKATRDLPAAVKKTLANWRGGGFDSGERPVLWTLPRDLDLEPGPEDILAIGEETRLKGRATCEKISIATRFGEKEISFSDVAALAGPRFRGRDTQIYLRDGQLLSGAITTRGLRFALNAGPSINLDIASVDRLVTREPIEADVDVPAHAAIVETFDGDRLALDGDSTLRLSVVTPWGSRELGLADIRWIRNVTNEQAGYEAALTDGSRFFCFLDGTKVPIKTLAFGPRELHVSQIKMLSTETAAPGGKDDERRLDQPHVILTGGQVLVGSVDRETIPLMTLGGSIPVPPAQIQVMRNGTEDGETVPGHGGFVYRAELWGGGTIVGRYHEPTLPCRVGDAVWQLPPSEVSEVVSPTPIVPEATYVRALELVRDLGHSDWRQRDAAQRELVSLGSMAVSALREAGAQSPDAEVRRRSTAILEEIE